MDDDTDDDTDDDVTDLFELKLLEIGSCGECRLGPQDGTT